MRGAERMIKRGLFVYNQSAGKSQNGKPLAEILDILKQGTETLLVHEGKDPEEVKEFLEDEENLFDFVWIFGGDGSVHLCVDSLRRRKKVPGVGILPGGTCNDFARSLGLPMDPVQAAKVTMEQNLVWIDLGCYNGRAFTNFAGVGIIADTSENIDEGAKEKIGRVSYFMSAWQTMRDAETFSYTLTADGEKISGDAVMILVCNGRFIGTVGLPFPTINMGDEVLDIVILEDAGAMLFREWLHRSGKKEPVWDTEGVKHFQAGSIRLETSPVKKLDTDGEIESETPVDIGVLPKALAFACGQDERF